MQAGASGGVGLDKVDILVCQAGLAVNINVVWMAFKQLAACKQRHEHQRKQHCQQSGHRQLLCCRQSYGEKIPQVVPFVAICGLKIPMIP